MSLGALPEQIDDPLFWSALLLAAVLVFISLLLVHALIVRRERVAGPPPAPPPAPPRSGLAMVQAGVVLGALVLVLALASHREREAWGDPLGLGPEERPEESECFLVRVVGEQFAWHFVYPGVDGRFEPSDLARAVPGLNPLGLEDPAKDVYRSRLVVPLGAPVLLELRSAGRYDPGTRSEVGAVVHAFHAPALRLKADVVPGERRTASFRAERAGELDVVCAELCGLGHYQMGAKLEVLEDAGLRAALGYDWRGEGAFPASFARPGRDGGGR
jgi:heme/copper-type cytochrome/quinol oxidase subunit 2